MCGAHSSPVGCPALPHETDYAMVAGISHAMVIGMCHVGCKGILHDHAVYLLAMWYAFLTMWYAFSKSQKI